MKAAKSICLSIFIFSSLSASHQKQEVIIPKPLQAVQIQESKDNTKIKLALLAAVVTIATIKYSENLGLAIAFDKLVMFLWNK